MIIYKEIENGWDKKINILGLRVYKRSLIESNGGYWCKQKYLFGLFRTIENKNEKKYFICGIKVWQKSKKVTYDMIMDVVNEKEKRVVRIQNRMQDLYYDMQVLSQVQTLHKPYLKYKRINEGKDVVLVATGPTNIYYIPIENAVHVGINAAIYLEDIKFNYLFANDYFLTNQKLNEDIDKYIGNNCQKFFAIPSEHRLKINQNNGMPIERHPQYRFYNENVLPYCLLDSKEKKWAVNIECEPFGDFGGTAFSALQFICYTNPKRIYLVGCDCGTSYSPSACRVDNYNHHIKLWESFRNFISTVYPNTEVISVNPIGLKGIFKDVYTNSYLEQNPDLRQNPGEDICILNECANGDDYLLSV